MGLPTTVAQNAAAFTFPISPPPPQCMQQLIVPSSAYFAGANAFYLFRRAQMRKMDWKKLLKIRLTRDKNLPWRRFLLTLLVWQAFVLSYPVIEPLVGVLFQRVSFFLAYPNAGGCGIVFEPRDVQHLKQSHRTKQQIRIDWHDFTMNVGDVGRDGYRHPPSVTRTLPHLDIPKKGIKHWPWRRRNMSLNNRL